MTQTAAPPSQMSFIAQRAELAHILATASRVIRSRTPKPVLLCVKLVADDGTLTVQATDLQTAIRCTTSLIQIEHTGTTCVAADKLLAVVRAATGDTVALSMQGDSLQIKTESGRHKLYTNDPADFPPFPSPAENQGGEVAGVKLADALRQVSVAIGEDGRFAFGAANLKASKDQLLVTGTNGKILLESKLEWSGSSISALLPRDSLPVVLLSLEETESVRLWHTENLVGVKSDHFEVVATQVEGKFPNYEDEFPKQCATAATLGLIDAIQAIEQASLPVLEESVPACRFLFNKSGLYITARSASGGESEVTLPCKVEGETIEISFNAKLLLAGLKAATTDSIKFEMTAPNRNGGFRNGKMMFVISPVNLT